MLTYGFNPDTVTRTTLKIKNVLREAMIMSKGFAPLFDRMKLGAYKKACILDRNE